MNTPARPPSALTIAGSDSGGGAGIQADLRTFTAFGVHGTSAIAALTAQNTRGVTAVHVPPIEFLRAQIDACFSDFDIRAVKLGMLATAEVIHAVADALDTWKPTHVVVDPVMIATSGARLLEPAAVDAVRTRLLPLATVLTPNIPEAETLLGRSITNAGQATAALESLRAMGPKAVMLKGAHLDEHDGTVHDRWLDDAGTLEFVHPRLAIEGHGTGCTLASAIAAGVALGMDAREAARAATDYVAQALAAGCRPGLGDVVVLGRVGYGDSILRTRNEPVVTLGTAGSLG